MGSGRNRCFGVVSFFFRILPYHLFHREQTQLFCLPPNHWPGICGIRRLWHVCQEISSLNSFITKGWPDHNGCRAVALGSGGVSFVGSVHGTLGVDSYGVGGGLGGRKAMRIELSAFRHNRFNRYRRCFVVVP